jgi:hypothetical protein
MRSFRLLLNPNPTPGGGDPSPPPPAPAPVPPPAPAPQPQPDFARLLAESGNVSGLARQLYEENQRLTRELAADRLRVPGEGQVVLTQEDADLLARYREIGEPEAITSATTELATLKRKSLLRDVANAYGYDADVLGELPGIESLEINPDGEDTKTKKPKFRVKVADKETPFSDYVESKFAKFMPVLKPKAGDPGTPRNPTPTPAPSTRTDATSDEMRQRHLSRHRL